MSFIKTLWRFGRPHTLVGTTVSIFCLFIGGLYSSMDGYKTGWSVIGANQLQWAIILFGFTWICCLLCNVFITGLNQITDLEIDKINKPNLPLIDGSLKSVDAKKIVVLALIGSLSIAFFLSSKLGVLIALISFLGWAYSSYPIRFKRFHIWAAMAISIVRGPLVNLGIAMFFVARFNNIHIDSVKSFYNTLIEPSVGVWLIPLTIFISLFSIGIAWFKDLPDTEGDAKFQINTLTVKQGGKFALNLGGIVLIVAYCCMIFWGFVWSFSMLLFHLFALIMFVYFWLSVELTNQKSIKRFYMSYWLLFFAEYIFFMGWFIL